jgi:hypothetical protein
VVPFQIKDKMKSGDGVSTGLEWFTLVSSRLGEVSVFFGGDQNIINRRKTTWVID